MTNENLASRARTAIIVLGMHRSGTSATAGLLNKMGCDLPNNLMAPHDMNAKGFFESNTITLLNDAILASAGMTWFDLNCFPGSWYYSPKAPEFKEQARAALNDEFGASGLFVLKDPRHCRLVPFWEDVFTEQDVQPVYICIHRNPIEVAASLQKWHGTELLYGQLLWLRHVLDAEITTRGKKRVFVSYDQILSDWRDVVGHISNNLDLVFPRSPATAAWGVHKFLSGELRHFSSVSLMTRELGETSDWLMETWEVLNRWSRTGEDAAGQATFDNVRDAMNAASATMVNLATNILARYHETGHQSEQIAALNVALTNSEEMREQQSAQLNLVNAALAVSEEMREQQSAQLNLVNAALAELKHGGAMMAEQMRHTEARPWRPLKWAIQRAVLKFALLFDGLMPEPVNLRLRRSLAKRKPRRYVYGWAATVAKASRLDVPFDPLLAPRVREDGGLIRNKLARNLRQSQLNAQTEKQAAHTTPIDEELVITRTRPMRVAQNLIQFRALTFLSKICAPISPRRAARFANSAAKRDPSRPTLAMTQKIKEKDQPDYNAVLRSWSEQRAAGSVLHTQMVDSLRDGPLLSLAVPVYNPDPDLLSQMIKSALAQSYPNWELCMADDCSTDKRVVEVLNSYQAQDKRIRVVFRKENGHISRATNSAINICNGRFIALLDHDDLLDPDALLWVAKAIRDEPRARIIYTDEDKVREDGSRCDPHFKPDWNRDLLYCINYVSHLGVYETALVREVGGFREGFEGAQDYDLLLRCVEKVSDSQIVHIPKVLYSWRATPGSTAASMTAKPYASAAGERALAEHLKLTTGQDITVSPGPAPVTYRANWTVQDNPLVSIIIPTRDHLDVLKVAVESVLAKTDYAKFELIIVDNGSVEPCTLQWFDHVTAQDNRVRVLKDDRPFNYSTLNNNAVMQSRGEFLALVNNDIEVISPNWLSEMLALAQRPRTGCVGAKLCYPDGRIQHAGVVIGMGGVAGHVHLFFPAEHPGYFCRLKLRQNYTAVTGACLVVRRSIYEEVEGLNEKDLAIAFNDVDFCLKVDAAGYRNVWTPWAELIHHESISRGYEDTPEKQARFRRECDYMKGRWRTHMFNDPAYNPNLASDRHDFGLGPANWKLM